ncbi:MAG: hypothetical protein ACREO4_16280 [Lysobacter sp.]
MKLLTPPAWLDKYFATESRPAEVTALRWLRAGKVAGRKVGGKWFVDEHAWLAANDDPAEADLVQRVLDGR